MTFATGQSNNPFCRTRGFTLVELILVMAILVCMMAVAAPSLGKFFRGRKQDSEARRILSLIRYGQTRAVSEGIPTLLWFDVKKGAYGLELASGYTSWDDTKFIELEMDSDLAMEVKYRVIKSVNKARSLPVIRMEPDGSFDLTSPEYIAIKEANSPTIYVVKSQNGMTYEISNQNTDIEKAFR
jgi:prepilin-type N-terminal cleavage/methylation domain-containing protein